MHISNLKKKLYGLFLEIRFNCLKAAEPLVGDRLLFTIKFPNTPNKNKRRLCGRKNLHKMGLKSYFMNRPSAFSVTCFLVWRLTFPCSEKQLLFLTKLAVGFFQIEYKKLLSSSQWIYHLLPQKLAIIFDLISELCKIQVITFSILEPIK